MNLINISLRQKPGMNECILYDSLYITFKTGKISYGIRIQGITLILSVDESGGSY